jgi:hypothetical protein
MRFSGAGMTCIASGASGFALRGDYDDQLIFVAPDVDRELFTRGMLEAKGLGRSVTLYASSDDRALQVAGMLASEPRAGAIVDGGPLIIPGAFSRMYPSDSV